MIYDRSSDTVFGYLGWVDQGSLWLYSLLSGAERRIAVEGADHLGVEPGLNGLFRLVHHGSADVVVSIRRYEAPEVELATLCVSQGNLVLAGETELWRNVDPAVIVRTSSGPRLVRVDPLRGNVTDLDLSWFTNGPYDLGYQGLVDCISLSELGLVAVAVQRSSELVLIDVDRNQRVGSILLGDRGGNPDLKRRSANEFVASDYDCLCLVDASSGKVRPSKLLQEPTTAPFTQQFIGGYDVAGTRCAVARPYSGDVMLLDLPTLEVRENVPVTGQPLAVCMTSPSTFVTRDWQTGGVRLGNFSA